ncbi:hypothetical protein PIB30_020383 [Stylosanthes scabra]|uniref:Uncharacterized protein n=1 Tax=Stylosanthes scabra TaxID=79078 RepID=A0ABU6Q8J5_9FABA|nr:hypothetical protein [Stylosanthes scabra]
MEVFVGGAPARPRWCARATPFRNAQDKDVARLRGDDRTHLNEGYFGYFTFPSHGPFISQAQFDLYGGETAEAQHTFSHFINFSLGEVGHKDPTPTHLTTPTTTTTHAQQQQSSTLSQLSLTNHTHTPLSIRHNSLTGAPIAAPPPATRSSRFPLRMHARIKVWVALVQGGNNQAGGIEGLSEEARVHSNWGGLQENLNYRSSRLERYSNRFEPSQILKTRDLRGANDSAYGNSGPSGVVSSVGSLFPRGTKANVAAYGSGRGASCHRPGYQPRMVLRGSTNDGCPELVPDRSGLAIITDRMSSS